MPVQKNILLVEDEPTLQRILGSVLGDAGHLVTATGTAEQAAELLGLSMKGGAGDASDIDLVLTDKNLPKLSGLDLLASVRAAEQHGRKLTGVILVTGYPSRDTALTALADDADGYLVKPFRSLSHAVEQIQRVLDADLVLRRQGPPLARRVAAVLAGLPETLTGVEVVVQGEAGSEVVAVVTQAVTAAGARVVDAAAPPRPELRADSRVAVGTDVKALCALGKQRPGTGLVLLDAGASFGDIVEVITAGGGALVDRALLAPHKVGG